MFTSLLIAAALQAAVPACTAVVPPPAGLEAWERITAITTDPIAIGAHSGVKLGPVASASFARPPERKPADGSFGGVYHFTVTTAGTYRVALDGSAWIDLVNKGAGLKPTAHTEGAPCSGIRKIVDFALVPGDYVLQLSGAKTMMMTVLIAAAR